MPLSANSFPKSEKLKKGKDFERVYKQGKRLSGQRIIVYYLSGFSEEGGKAGFTVSKKVSKSAVKRNRIKRRFREIYRLNKHVIPHNHFLIIRALPKAAEVDFYELKNEIVELFSVIASGRSGRRGNQNL